MAFNRTPSILNVSLCMSLLVLASLNAGAYSEFHILHSTWPHFILMCLLLSLILFLFTKEKAFRQIYTDYEENSAVNKICYVGILLLAPPLLIGLSNSDFDTSAPQELKAVIAEVHYESPPESHRHPRYYARIGPLEEDNNSYSPEEFSGLIHISDSQAKLIQVAQSRVWLKVRKGLFHLPWLESYEVIP